MAGLVEELREMGGHSCRAHLPMGLTLREAADRITALEAENARLRSHIAEQITHVETRIQDGIELGATVWRIALEDIVRENRQALKETPDGP